MPCHAPTQNTHTQTHAHTLQQQATTATIAADYCRLTCNKHNRTHTHAYILVSRQQKISPLSFSEEILTITTTATAVKTQQHNA